MEVSQEAHTEICSHVLQYACSPIKLAIYLALLLPIAIEGRYFRQCF